jgi:hypothetical protein
VNLGATVEHGGDEGNANTPADIAGEIHQAGGGVVFISREKCVGSGIDGDE